MQDLVEVKTSVIEETMYDYDLTWGKALDHARLAGGDLHILQIAFEVLSGSPQVNIIALRLALLEKDYERLVDQMNEQACLINQLQASIEVLKLENKALTQTIMMK